MKKLALFISLLIVAMMIPCTAFGAAATHSDLLVGSSSGGLSIGPGVKLVYLVIDLDEAATDIKTGNVFEAGDVLQALQIPAYTMVLNAGLICTEAESTTLTLDVGDGDQADGYVDGYDAESTGGSGTAIAEAYGPDNAFGRLYTSADTIDLKIVTIGAQTANNAVVTVWAICVQVPTE